MSGTKSAAIDLWEELFRIRDEQRASMHGARVVLKGRELAWQHTRQGKIRWYAHPSIRDTGDRSYIVYMQEIPAGSRSGRVRQQGNEVIVILHGHGYTMLDGERHDWKAGDVVNLPIKPEGIDVQHFNVGTSEPVRFLSARPNFVDVIGVDAGSGFEQLEDAPEWHAGGAQSTV